MVYSDHQRLELEKEFHYSRYITIRRKAELANSVGLSERQVKMSATVVSQHKLLLISLDFQLMCSFSEQLISSNSTGSS